MKIVAKDSSDLEDALMSYIKTWDIEWDVKFCTWDDVFDELQAAEDEYKRKGKGAQPVHLVRGVLRQTGDNAADITPWLDIIPGEFGLSILSAGLKLVFSVRGPDPRTEAELAALFNIVAQLAKQQAEIRETILEAFRSIPDIIAGTIAKRCQFKRYPALRKCAVNLYVKVIEAVQQLIAKLNASRSGNMGRQMLRYSQKILRPTIRAEEINGILNDMQGEVQRFQVCLDNIRDGITIETNTNTREALIQTKAVRETVSHTGTDVTYIRRHWDDFERKMQDTNAEGEKMRRELQRIANGIDAQNSFLHALIDEKCQQIEDLSFTNCFPFSNRVQSCPAIQNSPDTASFLSGEQLLQALNVYHMGPVNDLKDMLRSEASFNDTAQMQAQQLLSSARFHEWLSSSNPDLLLVNGNYDDHSRTSPLSCLSAHLAIILSQRWDFTVTHFFCGQNDSRMSPVSGPLGLLRSLTTQLLHSGHPLNYGFIDTRPFANGIRQHNIQDLCWTLGQLIRQLPRGQGVLCLIENIGCFEREEWRSDLRDVVEMLYRTATDPYLWPNLKVLITNATARTRIERELPPEMLLSLSRDKPYARRVVTERGMLSDLQPRRRNDYQERMQTMEVQNDDSDEDY